METVINETVINNIFLDQSKFWTFENPVKVTMEFDYDSPPIGSAILFHQEDGMYADIILDGKKEAQLELYPHISFSKNSKTIRSIRLSAIQNTDERVKTIDQQAVYINLSHF